MSGAGAAAKHQADCPMHRAQAVRLACSGAGYAGQWLGEGSPRTFTNGAAEAADPDEQKRRVAEAGDVAEAAPVDAVNPPRERSA